MAIKIVDQEDQSKFSMHVTTQESFAVPQTHPNHLHTIATLFSLKPTSPSNASILEIGCGSGSNILPIALNYPDARVVGVDTSEKAIAEAKQHKQALKVKNLELVHSPIMDISQDLGKFDYIIVHSMISWLPQEARMKVFNLAKEMLTDQGILYVSYNTLPGWNMVRSVADAIRYHNRAGQPVAYQIQQARLLLGFLAEATQGDDAYTKLFKQEAKLLSELPDYYLYQEYLSPDSQQFYFHEINQLANDQGLAYLADANISSMYLGNLPQNTAQKLQEVENIIDLEQYLDFINNRRFRCSLFCKNSAAVYINRKLDGQILEDFYLSMRLVPEAPLSADDISGDSVVKFISPNNPAVSVSVSGAAMKAALYALSEARGYSLSVDQIAKDAIAKCKSLKASVVKKEFLDNALVLIFSNVLSITTAAPAYTRKLSNKPKLHVLAKYQASELGSHKVTNLRHESLNISHLETLLFKYLDGQNTIKDVIELLLKDFQSGQLSIARGNKPVTGLADIRVELEQNLENYITKYLHTALLVS